MNPRIRTPRLLASLALLGACGTALAQAQEATAPADERIPLAYEATARESQATVHKGTCPVRVLPTEDQRQNKLTIGAYMGGPLLTTDASPWLTDGLLHLKDFGYAVERTDGAQPPAEGLLVTTAVTRAYTWQVGLKIFGMLALKAQFVDKDGKVTDKYYRAHGDKTNMWGAKGEYVTTLNYGLNNLLRVMAEDLAQLCQGKPVEAYSYAGPEVKPSGK